MPGPNAFITLLEALLAVRNLRGDRGVGLDRYYLGNLGLLEGPALSERQFDPDHLPQVVAKVIQSLRQTPPPPKPAFAGRNIFVALRDEMIEDAIALNRALEPYTDALFRLGNQGGTNWFSPSFSPRTGLFYVTAWENTATTFAKRDVEYTEGTGYLGGANRGIYGPGIGMGMPRGRPVFNYKADDENYAAVRALDPVTGERKWEFKMSDSSFSGNLTTATDLLFTGNSEGYSFALDARTGALLWKVSLGGNVVMGPMSYSVAGKQYVAAAAGNALFVFGLR